MAGAAVILRAVPRLALRPGAWDAYVETHPGGWWFHTEAWLAYCLAYRPGSIDRSVALVAPNDAVVAVLPLIQEGDAFTMGGEPGAVPLWNPAVAASAVWEAVEIAAQSATILDMKRVARAAFRWQPRPPDALMPHRPEETPPGYRWWQWGTFVVDLREDEAVLWRHVRKSYRHLIRRTADPYVAPPSVGASLTISTAREIHHAAAGRITRSLVTWDLMTEWAASGAGLLAIARGRPGQGLDESGDVGYAYALRWKQWAYYASGATVVDDVAHALQWALIRTLRADDRRCYEVGWDVRPGEEADEKARGIALFKRGFGGARWLVHAIAREFS